MPYTIGLLGSIPRLDAGRGQPLTPIEGVPPSLVDLPQGCPFVPRCPARIDICSEIEPELDRSRREHRVGLPPRRPRSPSGTLDRTAIFAAEVVVPERAGAPAARAATRRCSSLDKVVRRFPIRKGSVLRRKVGAVHAVDGISFDIRKGETLGLVGESGCGKTTTIMEILGLLPPQEGTIAVLGNEVAGLSRQARMGIRRDLQVVFQDPMASLDPRLPDLGHPGRAAAHPRGGRCRARRPRARAA